jgi:hypothetical protein
MASAPALAASALSLLASAARLVSQDCQPMNAAVMLVPITSIHCAGVSPCGDCWFLPPLSAGACLVANRWGNYGWVLILCRRGYVGGTLFGVAPWCKTNDQGERYCGDKGWFHLSDKMPQSSAEFFKLGHYPVPGNGVLKPIDLIRAAVNEARRRVDQDLATQMKGARWWSA